MIDPLDDDIRGLIATERDRAPLPLPWEEIVARTDRRAALRRRPLLLAAAALLAVGLLGLVAIAVTRAVDQEPADTPPTPSTTIPVTPTTVTSTVEAKDRLVGLTDSDWVVPGELPDGYTRLVASVTGFDDNASLQIFGDADGGSRVWLRVGESGSESDDGEAIVIDGVTWQRHTFAPIEEVGEFVDLVRSVNGRSVTLQSVGNPGVLEQFARALVVVPGDEIDFEYLDPSGLFTDVVTIDSDADAVTLGVIGLNGYYCWKIDLESGASGSGACEFTTTPDHPVLELGSLERAGRLVHRRPC